MTENIVILEYAYTRWDTVKFCKYNRKIRCYGENIVHMPAASHGIQK